ncbi:hypothetical protein H8S90_15960 [Olivibacter sp. SDN3]|uniref:hypothetical protein n=1 Tax=Olivibacter sp. SDN3 TaxID=2764720 RepID=UPI001650F1EE|nr:hypothetical protein [Olivibacter sp. SDN3]QNL48287.1 hypothetical protein H8S90_15960 [Olivibacter sp. SDN3]
MKNIEIIGIQRGKTFSPNHIGNDEAIFQLTMQALREEGCKVTILNEETFLSGADVTKSMGIVSMARNKDAVKKLQQLERDGVPVVNSGFGVENCFRTNMTSLLIQHQIPYPKSKIVSTDKVEDNLFDGFSELGVWIKRGDFHAIHKEDVTFASSRQEGKEILREYALREIPDAVLSEHLIGDLVKFYGVRDTDFFYWFYPYEHNHHKYEHYEQFNGNLVYNNFDEAYLRQVALNAAEVLDVYVFGGDAIVDKAGNIHIIDLNDWPSFAPCRDTAAPYIAQLLLKKFEYKTDGIIAREKQ